VRGVRGYGARVPPRARAAWAAEIARLPSEVPGLAPNGASAAERIREAIDFAFGPDNLGREYEVVIRSGRALREKWSKLAAAIARARDRPRPDELGFVPDPLAERQQREIDEWVKHGKTPRSVAR
jgi:hypothetical protein